MSESVVAIFALLIAGHTVADFLMQPRAMVLGKRRNPWLAAHGAIVAVIHAAFLAPVFSLRAAAVAVGLGAVHAAIDVGKIALRGRATDSASQAESLWLFSADQAVHLLALAVALLLLTAGRAVPFGPTNDPAQVTVAASLVAAYAFNTTGAATVVRAVLDRLQLGRAGEGAAGSGRTIGILERMLCLTFVLIDQWGALAFLIAAKSIARFRELEKREFGEYYLIGTLTSVWIAVLSGLAVRGVFQLTGWP